MFPPWPWLSAPPRQAWVDGQDAAKKFRRIEKNARKEFDQRFWWAPGDPLPERAPDLGAVGG